MTKTTPQPTPGPWLIEDGPHGTTIYSEPHAVVIASMLEWPTAQDEQDANARLIANAPRVAQEHAEMVAIVQKASRALKDLGAWDKGHMMLMHEISALLARIEQKP